MQIKLQIKTQSRPIMEIINYKLHEVERIFANIRFMKKTDELSTSLVYKILKIRYDMRQYLNAHYVNPISEKRAAYFTKDVIDMVNKEGKSAEEIEEINKVNELFNKSVETITGAKADLDTITDVRFNDAEIKEIIKINTLNVQYDLYNDGRIVLSNEDFLEYLYADTKEYLM